MVISAGVGEFRDCFVREEHPEPGKGSYPHTGCHRGISPEHLHHQKTGRIHPRIIGVASKYHRYARGKKKSPRTHQVGPAGLISSSGSATSVIISIRSSSFRARCIATFSSGASKIATASYPPGSPVDLPVFNLSLCIGLNIPHVLGNHICREVLLELRQCDKMNHSPHPLLRALQHMKGEI